VPATVNAASVLRRLNFGNSCWREVQSDVAGSLL